MKTKILAVVLLLAILGVQVYATFVRSDSTAADSALHMAAAAHDNIDASHGAIGQIYAQGEANGLLLRFLVERCGR